MANPPPPQYGAVHAGSGCPFVSVCVRVCVCGLSVQHRSIRDMHRSLEKVRMMQVSFLETQSLEWTTKPWPPSIFAPFLGKRGGRAFLSASSAMEMEMRPSFGAVPEYCPRIFISRDIYICVCDGCVVYCIRYLLQMTLFMLLRHPFRSQNADCNTRRLTNGLPTAQ